MSLKPRPKAKLYIGYPWTSIFIYNGSIIVHFLVGGIGIIIGYGFSSWVGYALGSLYLIFAFAEMYIAMPLKVCPNCIYYRTDGSLCISGLNVVSGKIASEGYPRNFPKRAEGVFYFNNLYMAALFIPVMLIIPALIMNFSVFLLVLFLALIALLLFRFFVVFVKIACIHCLAKFKCPQAGSMGVRDL